MTGKVKKMRPRAIEENRGKWLGITAGVLAILLVVILGVLVFTGGGGDGNRGIVAQESEEATPATEEGVEVESTEGLTIEQVEISPLSINRRRNPFKPLICWKQSWACSIEEAAPVEPLGGGLVTVPPELERGRTGGPAEAGEPEVVSTIITLEDIYEEDGKLYASITVADQLFGKVVEGETFAENYKLLVLDRASGATVLFGDERFSFYVGQSIYW